MSFIDLDLPAGPWTDNVTTVAALDTTKIVAALQAVETAYNALIELIGAPSGLATLDDGERLAFAALPTGVPGRTVDATNRIVYLHTGQTFDINNPVAGDMRFRIAS